jgi:3-hydroxybutyryl-CoA dehydrogenase
MDKGSAVVVGCGIMGCDIAAIFLKAGWKTQAVAPSLESWATAIQRMESSVAQLDGRLDRDLLRLQPSIQAVDWTGVDIVIETVNENLQVKQKVFRELDQQVPANVPIGSNSSGLRITDISAGCASRARMANAHFFLPAHLVPLVEIAKGEHTTRETVDRLHEIFTAVGRVAVRVNRDVPGLLANRIQHALMREAFSVIDAGLATAEDVDAAVRFGFGFRYVAAGPILQKEFAGLDTQFAAASSIYPSLCNDTAPSKTLSAKVSAGRFGIKSKHGFWDWSEEQITAERTRYENTLLKAAILLASSNTELPT